MCLTRSQLKAFRAVQLSRGLSRERTASCGISNDREHLDHIADDKLFSAWSAAKSSCQFGVSLGANINHRLVIFDGDDGAFDNTAS
jgi:hypothetical protein